MYCQYSRYPTGNITHLTMLKAFESAYCFANIQKLVKFYIMLNMLGYVIGMAWYFTSLDYECDGQDSWNWYMIEQLTISNFR